jgi:hypothetical protein
MLSDLIYGVDDTPLFLYETRDGGKEQDAMYTWENMQVDEEECAEK